MALRSIIVSSLTCTCCILGADKSARRSVEEELKTLEVTEGESAPACAMNTWNTCSQMYCESVCLYKIIKSPWLIGCRLLD